MTETVYESDEYFNALMQEAAHDEDFLERTYRCAEDFKYADSEVQGEWQPITR